MHAANCVNASSRVIGVPASTAAPLLLPLDELPELLPLEEPLAPLLPPTETPLLLPELPLLEPLELPELLPVAPLPPLEPVVAGPPLLL
jgi:hypothetical protein